MSSYDTSLTKTRCNWRLLVHKWVEQLVTLALPNKEVALGETIPDRLRIPLLTGLTTDDARANSNCALKWVCRNGHLEVAQWLTERFWLTVDDARANNNDALRWACENEHLGVAQWLTERFWLTVDDARTNNNSALRWACFHGHLEVVRWLEDKFGITRTELND
jgi:ankyrin repeat protein